MSFLYEEIKKSVSLAVPLMLSFLLQTGMWVVDSIMMGYLGRIALAAGALAITTYYLVQVLFMGMTNAVGISIGQARGESRDDKVALYLQQGAYLVFLLVLPMMLCLWNIHYLFTYFGQDGDVVKLASEFLRGAVWGVLGLLGYSLLRELCANFELPGYIVIVSCVGLLLNGVLDYMFIHGSFGLPQLGMYGIGLSTSVVQLVMLIALLACTLKNARFKPYLSRSLQKINPDTLKELISLGLPLSLTYFFEAGLFNASALLMGVISVSALAAHQVLLQCTETVFMCVFALAQATSIRVAYFAGGKQMGRVKVVALVNCLLGLLVAAIVSVIYLCFYPQITGLFTRAGQSNISALLEYTQHFFFIAAIFVFFDALQIIGNNALRAMKDTFVPMLLGLGAYWLVGLGSALIFVFTYHYGADYVWWGLTLGVLVSSLLIWLRWFYIINRFEFANTVNAP